MTWLKVDDSIYDHPKFDHVTLQAVGLWMFAGAYCARHLTDGRISRRAVARLGGDDDTARELIDAGLWHESDDGYEFHDWHDHQPSREEIHERRRASADRVRKHRQRRKVQAVDEPVTESPAPLVTENVTRYNVVTERVTNAPCNATPDPTRPDPTRPVETPKSVTRKRATPPPDVFEITDDMRRWAAAKASGVNLEDETERLLDWARANGRSYKDWKAAWRNWIKNAKTRTPAARTPPPTTVDKLTALNQRIQARRQAGIA